MIGSCPESDRVTQHRRRPPPPEGRCLNPFTLAGLPLPLAPAIGVIYVVTEWDLSKESTMEAGHAAFNSAIRDALDQVVIEVNLLDLDIDLPERADQRAIADTTDVHAIVEFLDQFRYADLQR